MHTQIGVRMHDSGPSNVVYEGQIYNASYVTLQALSSYAPRAF